MGGERLERSFKKNRKKKGGRKGGGETYEDKPFQQQYQLQDEDEVQEKEPNVSDILHANSGKGMSWGRKRGGGEGKGREGKERGKREEYLNIIH